MASCHNGAVKKLHIFSRSLNWRPEMDEQKTSHTDSVITSGDPYVGFRDMKTTYSNIRFGKY